MAEIFTGLASQSGHWYSADGSPAYEMTGANGKVRPVTLRDARKLNLYPSVTTILSVAAKPQLEMWKVKQGILSALTLPRAIDEDDTSFANRAMADSKEQGRKAAELGTLIHSEIERSFYGDPSPEWMPFVAPVRAWLRERFGGAAWIPERSFSSPLGFGGKIDLAERNVVLDFKTKDFTDATTIKAYDEHGIQLAAYARGLGMDNTATRVNLFVSTRTPGLIVPWEWEGESFSRHWGMFQALLAYWQADKGYAPAMDQAA